MKKVILILAVILVSAVTWQCTQEDVYMDEQVQTKIEHLTTPPPDDGGGDGYGYHFYCAHEDAWGGVSHYVYTNGYTYKCKRLRTSQQYHARFYSADAANEHCRNPY